jgi:hypothetical protein
MLEQYFSDERIIHQLCKERIKLASSRHDRQYINRLAGHTPETTPSHRVYQLLPPRREWTAFRPQYRTDGLNPDFYALKRAVRILRHQQPEPQWACELNRYIIAIRARVFDCPTFVISPPAISWELKKKGGNEYRALCRFAPDDNLILCLYAQYLRDMFDAQFSSSSYAFRAPRDGQNPTHHDAFTQVYNLKHNSPDRSLFVAECDIQGFFDSVDHGVALRAFQRAVERVTLHPRAGLIFQAYLDCYSFPVNVLDQVERRLQENNHKERFFKWPKDELREIHGTDPHSLRIGVAQGGAISGIIANLVMDEADKCVEAERERLGAEVHYYRYCDDMLLISPNQKDCQVVFDAYLKILTELKLAFHEPEKTKFYSKSHWDHKSKAPYLWSGMKWFGCVPWVQFVGYQIRYDGLVRPRKDSVRRQCQKLVDTTKSLMFGLISASRHHPIAASRNQAIASLKSKLVAQGVGRIKYYLPGPKPMCWAWGYKALHMKPLIDRALRSFDKTRAKQIRRLGNAQIRYGIGRPNRGGARRDPVGYAFSYHAQFTNAGGRDLIMNPWRPRNLKDKLKSWAFLKFKSIVSQRSSS